MNANYLEVNRAAYEQSAPEFEQKIELRRASDERLVPELCGYFEDRFNPARILELGTGSGYIAKLLSERGHEVTAIEFSPKMADVAKRTAPNVTLIVDDFLAHNFEGTRFDVVAGIAFIHLFPENDARKVMRKIESLLASGGIALVATTVHDEIKEGFSSKDNFQSSPVRFRRQYTRAALEDLVTSGGLTAIGVSVNPDSEGNAGKEWITVIAEKKS